MSLGKPVVIADFYEWLPGDGEDSVKLEYDRDFLDLIIQYYDKVKGIDVSRVIRFHSATYFYKEPLRGPEVYELTTVTHLFDSDVNSLNGRTYGKLIEYKECELCRKYEDYLSKESGISKWDYHFYSVIFIEKGVKIWVISEGVSVLDPFPV
jgi:hypothetical protein